MHCGVVQGNKSAFLCRSRDISHALYFASTFDKNIQTEAELSSTLEEEGGARQPKSPVTLSVVLK